MNFDRRSEAREQVKLPVSLPGGDAGLTRDVSANGLYFEVDGRPQAGSTIALTVALPDDRWPMWLQAHGVVVRVEPREGRSGVGIRIVNSTLETLPQDACTKSIH